MECLKLETVSRPRGRPRSNLKGRHIGRWLVLGPMASDPWGVTTWLCRCACGTKEVLEGTTLHAGLRISCGCVRRGRPRNPKNSLRNEQIARERKRGDTLGQIAERHGISRQRVLQILQTSTSEASTPPTGDVISSEVFPCLSPSACLAGKKRSRQK